MSARTFFASLLILCCAGTASAATIFTTEAAFTAAAPGLTMESFETPFASGLNQSFGGFTMVKSGPTDISSFTFFPTDGTRAAATNWGNGQTITFTFSAAINAFGFNLVDFGSTGTPSSISLVTNAPENLGAIASAATDQPSGNILEFGMISSTSFTTVTLTYSGGGGDFVIFDEVRFGTVQTGGGGGPNPVPLPAAVWCGLAMGGMVLRRAHTMRRRS